MRAHLRGLSLALLLPLPLLAQNPLAPPGNRVVLLEGCRISLTVPPNIVPVEIQPDSFLAYYRADHAFLALICRPNPRRTFEPKHPGTPPHELAMYVLAGGAVIMKTFQYEMFGSADLPLKGLQSWNLRTASRDHVYHLMVYSNPDLLSHRENRARLQEEAKTYQARLESLIPLILFEDGVEPAIPESSYQERLMGAGIGLLFIFIAGIGAIILMKRRQISRKN